MQYDIYMFLVQHIMVVTLMECAARE